MDHAEKKNSLRSYCSAYLHCASKFHADTESRFILKKKKDRKEQSARKLERFEPALYQ